MDSATMSSDPAARSSIAWAWYGLLTLIAVSLMGNIIIQTIPVVAESIKQSLSLSDTQLGSLRGMALTATVALATIPMGWAADRIDRRWLLAICVIIWSASTFAFGLATTFPMLFLFAMGISIGEAVLGPITYAMIPDMFPRDKWITANFVFYVAMLCTFYAGIWFSGVTLGWLDGDRTSLPPFFARLESWRALMILCACTAPLLVVMLLLMRLNRSTSVREARNEGGLIDYFKTHKRTLAGVFLGFGLSYAATGAQYFGTSLILPRMFGVKPAELGQMLGIIGGTVGLTGVVLSWLAVRWLKPRFGENAAIQVAQGGLLLGLIASLFIPFIQSANQLYAVLAIKGMFTTVAISLSPAILQFLAPAHLRGRVVAIGGMVTIIGQSIMPPVMGLLSDKVFTGKDGMLWAMSVVVIPTLMFALLILRWGAVTLSETIRAANESEG